MLLGIPISVKDSLDVKGFDTTIGLAANCFDKKKEDGFCIKLLRDQGAIPLIKSNLSQISLSFFTINNFCDN